MTDMGESGALLALEPIFHRMPPGTGRAAFAEMTGEGFWEVGASGGVCTREEALDIMAQRCARADYPDLFARAEPEGGGYALRRWPDLAGDPWRMEDFAARPLAGDFWLVTYLLWQGPRQTRRATLWRRCDGGWKIQYHQGTAAAGNI